MLKEKLKDKASELGLQIGFTTREAYEEHKEMREYLKFTNSIISVAMPITKKDGAIMASFALELDYHFTLRELMDEMIDECLNGYHSVSYVDNGPVDDRLAAFLAGVGFYGKHSLIITPLGSYVVIGEILTDAVIEPDYPSKKNCGTCTICAEACPVEVIPDYIYDGCLVGYLQRKIALPDAIYEKFETIYGCDICQSVCPLNKQVGTKESYTYEDLDIIHILSCSKHEFRAYKETAFHWLGHNVIKRNILIYAANKGIDLDAHLHHINSKEEYMLSALDYYHRKKETK